LIPQQSWSAVQGALPHAGWHTLPTQLPGEVKGHAMPHPPQSFGSLVVSTQPARQQLFPPEQPGPAWHVAFLQAHD
jgi:hypothetical protein